jgi:hypothetical protein
MVGQVVGMPNGMLGYKYNGAIDALRTIVRVEGMAGLYRGLWANLRGSSFECLLRLGADVFFPRYEQ